MKQTTLITWTDEHQQSLQRIIDIRTNPPTLSYPDFSSPFKLYVDASRKGLGCDLYQKIMEKLKYWVTEIQDADKDIKRVKKILRQQIILSIDQKQQVSKLVRRLLKVRNKLSITDKDVLVRSTLKKNQIVLPSSHHHIIFQEICVNMAHLGDDRVYHLAKKRVYWPNMEKDIKECSVCTLRHHNIKCPNEFHSYRFSES